LQKESIMTNTGLKVLILGPYPEDPEKIVGGVEAVNNALVAALVAHPEVSSITVAMFRTKGGTADRRKINNKLEVRYLRVPFISGDVIIQSYQCVLAARRLVEEIKPDVVHAQGIDRQGDIATQLGLPAVVTVHGLVHIEARLAAKNLPGRIKVVLFDALVRRVLRKAQVVISISDYDAKSLEGLVRNRRISISNAIAPDFFQPFTEPAWAPRIFFAGVMRPRKNVLGLVNAFAKVKAAVPAAHLTIAGPMPEQAYAQKVQDRVQELGLKEAITFMGHVSNEQLLQAMRETAAVALFSYEETSPTIIAQSLAVGRPVVASRVGGIPEMITEGETGYIVQPGDEQALADRLIDLMKDPERTRAMGERGRAFARQRYEPSAVADQTVNAYRNAIAAVDRLAAPRTTTA
jgi:glycosyltransferase involved in cell wall biosynthesis